MELQRAQELLRKFEFFKGQVSGSHGSTIVQVYVSLWDRERAQDHYEWFIKSDCDFDPRTSIEKVASDRDKGKLTVVAGLENGRVASIYEIIRQNANLELSEYLNELEAMHNEGLLSCSQSSLVIH